MLGSWTSLRQLGTYFPTQHREGLPVLLQTDTSPPGMVMHFVAVLEAGPVRVASLVTESLQRSKVRVNATENKVFVSETGWRRANLIRYKLKTEHERILLVFSANPLQHFRWQEFISDPERGSTFKETVMQIIGRSMTQRA